MTPAPGEPKACLHKRTWFDRSMCQRADGVERMADICEDCGDDGSILPTDRPADANKTMGREFARVEFKTNKDGVSCRPYLTVGEIHLVRGMSLSDNLNTNELGHLAMKINAAHAQAVESAVKELKAERDGIKEQLNRLCAMTIKEMAGNLAGGLNSHEDCDAAVDALKKERDGAVEALKELLSSGLSEMPPYEAGKEAQDAWADRRAAARNKATSIIWSGK